MTRSIRMVAGAIFFFGVIGTGTPSDALPLPTANPVAVIGSNAQVHKAGFGFRRFRYRLRRHLRRGVYSHRYRRRYGYRRGYSSRYYYPRRRHYYQGYYGRHRYYGRRRHYGRGYGYVTKFD